MKRFVILLTVLATAACGYRQKNRDAVAQYDEDGYECLEEYEEYEEEPGWEPPLHHNFGADGITLSSDSDSIFYTYFGYRRGEIGKSYSNVFKYFVFRNEKGEIDPTGDEIVLFVKYGDTTIPMIANDLKDELAGWESDEMYRIEWKVDTMRRAVEPDKLWLQYFALKATREEEQGVVIAGTRWATRNVDAPGTFAAKPSSPGMFYQWNRKKGWPTVGETVEGWDDTVPTGSTWTRDNDPCPEGWKVPKYAQIKTLCDKMLVSSKDTGFQDDVNTVEFTDKATGNTILLPLVGGRGDPNGGLMRDSRIDAELNPRLFFDNFYWSSTGFSDILGKNDYAMGLDIFHADGIKDHGAYMRRIGGSIRCVAE
jgi:hypothetical protein